MDNPGKILVIQLKRAGDVLVTTPVVAALRALFPLARLDCLTEKPFAELLQNNPDIGTLQVYDKNAILSTLRRIRAERYDWILDFQSSPRSAIVVALSGAGIKAGYRVPFWGNVYNRTIPRPGGRQSVIEGKLALLKAVSGREVERHERKVFLTEQEQAWAQSRMKEYGYRQAPIGIIPTHRRNSRRWQAESFVSLARLMIQENFPVLFFWGPGEKAEVEAIQQKVPEARLIPST